MYQLEHAEEMVFGCVGVRVNSGSGGGEKGKRGNSLPVKRGQAGRKGIVMHCKMQFKGQKL